MADAAITLGVLSTIVHTKTSSSGVTYNSREANESRIVALYENGVCKSHKIQIGMLKMATSRRQSVTVIPVHRALCHHYVS